MAMSTEGNPQRSSSELDPEVSTPSSTTSNTTDLLNRNASEEYQTNYKICRHNITLAPIGAAGRGRARPGGTQCLRSDFDGSGRQGGSREPPSTKCLRSNFDCSGRQGGNGESPTAKCLRSDFVCSGRKVGRTPSQPPPPCRMADEWLPPTAFLPPGRVTPTASSCSPWTSSQGTPHRPHYSGLGGSSPSEWSPQQGFDAWTGAHDADKVYESVDDLAAAWHASMASLTAMPEFHAWQRGNPAFKLQLAGDLWTPQGP
jgi:hypothetical protein